MHIQLTAVCGVRVSGRPVYSTAGVDGALFKGERIIDGYWIQTHNLPDTDAQFAALHTNAKPLPIINSLMIFAGPHTHQPSRKMHGTPDSMAVQP